MGALHAGHLSLLEQAQKTCAIAVCSIFVNPLQFNDPKDLANYPRQLDSDARLLEEAGCELLFVPEKEQLFLDFEPIKYDLGGLDHYWEGPSRPGHFQGVVNVVERLFFYVRPDQVFFGEKDKQQLTILEHVAGQLAWPERIIGCPTTRESDGLALSSRNMRLDPRQRKEAVLLYQALSVFQEMAFKQPLPQVVRTIGQTFEGRPDVQLDYFGIADPLSLQPMTDWDDRDTVIALIAAQVGPVRLIDNVTATRS